MDEGRMQTARMLSINNNLVCQVFRSLEDACSADVVHNPFIPFGRTAVVKCNESKFNHKTKVSITSKDVHVIPTIVENVIFFSEFEKRNIK